MTGTAQLDTAADTMPPQSGHRRSRRKPLVIVTQVLLVVVALVLWELLVNAGILMEFSVARPATVAEAFTELLGSDVLWQHVRATFIATAVGFGLGSTLGIAAGMLLGSFGFLDRVASPFLAMANATPRIALAPLFIIWFGLTMWAKIWLAVSLVFFVLLYNTKAALRTVDDDHKTLAAMLDMSPWENFRKVTVPTCLPAILSGLRLSIVFALLGVIASEMISARDGLGLLAVEASSTFQVDRLFAILIVIAGIAVVMNAALDQLERYSVKWKEETS